MRIVEELNKGWQIQGFDENSLAFDEVGRLVELSDNFFDLIPGIKRRIRLSYPPGEVGRIRDKLIIM